MMKILSQKQILQIEEKQVLLQQKWKNRNINGELIEYLDKKFIVLANVFPPSNDSKVLVEHLPDLDGLNVLDLATGSGVIAIYAALKGAKNVTAVDINPSAVKCAQLNALEHGVSNRINIFYSDLFNQIKQQYFDVITVNLPFRNKPAPDIVASSQWDTNFELHKRFFSQVGDYLHPQGRLYIPQPNYPELYDTFNLAHDAGLKSREIGKRPSSATDPRDYYVFEMSFS